MAGWSRSTGVESVGDQTFIRMKAWHAFSLLVVVLVCGINLAATARRVPPPPRAPTSNPTNVVMRHEQRMAPVVRALRAREVRSPIGYLADVRGSELAASHSGMEGYFLTQFALTPWLLSVQPEACEWIVAHLQTTTLAERTPAGFRVAESFGDGVWLLERVRP